MTMNATQQPDVDRDQVRRLVEQAVKAAVPDGQTVERRMRPESLHSWTVPQPLAGLQAALLVRQIAENQAHKFALELRGEGTSWEQIADLLGIPWSADYTRQGQAFQLVSGGDEASHYGARAYWTCGGPLGCGEHISDHGPYDGAPANTENGHVPTCRRVTAETQAWERAYEEAEKRAEIMDEAFAKLTDDFSRETVLRARHVQSHGGKYLGWSTSETLAVTIALGDTQMMKEVGWATEKAAIERIMNGMRQPAEDLDAWVRLLRAAATGIVEKPKKRRAGK